jgi:hypothetical protein
MVKTRTYLIPLLLIVAISLPNWGAFAKDDNFSWSAIRHDSQNTGFSKDGISIGIRCGF